MNEPSRRPRGHRRPSTGASKGTPRDQDRASAIDEPRKVAYKLLRAVDEDGAYANLALPGLLSSHGLTGRDAAFATELAFGTLRWQGLYDVIIREATGRRLSELEPRVVDVLRLGCHQIQAMAVPDYAAVSASVSLARGISSSGPSRLVNAVLRRVASQSREEWVAQLAPDSALDPVGHLSVALSHPGWITRALRDALAGAGLGDLDTLTQLLATDNQPSSVMLVARPGRISATALAEQSGGSAGRWSPWAVLSPGGNPGDLAAVRAGLAGVQDEGSQLAALAFSRLAPQGDDDSWLDLCAGPGGKTAVLAGLAAEHAAAVTAVELHPHRAELVRAAVAGGPGTVHVETADATIGGWNPGTHSRVLLDAPCTGLGVLRRRPELRWRRKPADVATLASLQRRLLTAALTAVAPGGLALYVTCSPHVAETDAVVADVVRDVGGCEQEDARELLADVPDLGPGPAARLWPHVHGTDGMFIAVIRRR
ncbi:MAG: transcription antitermination factor NusB [Candidatus Nanopelagicales bacterium]|nr:transcription antitermination factor NusB [Candidatus Nanopelagicales bacterium]